MEYAFSIGKSKSGFIIECQSLGLTFEGKAAKEVCDLLWDAVKGKGTMDTAIPHPFQSLKDPECLKIIDRELSV